MAERNGRVQSVDRAAALLRAVASAAPHGAAVAAIATDVGLNRATSWRLLATLEANGLVERDPGNGNYLIGSAISQLAAVASLDGLVRRAHPVLERLCEQTGETADLAMVRAAGLTYVDEVAPATVMTANWLGRNVPLHATSSGKAWLAWLPPAEAATLMGANLTRYTPTTIADADELRAELAVIRNQGYGTCRGEFERQLFGVSAPLLVGGRPLAVVSIWGPSDRLTPDRFGELGSAAVAAAAEIGGVFRPAQESA